LIKQQIGQFYASIFIKDWDSAYEFSSGNLTKEQFIDLYKDTKFIMPSEIYLESGNESANYIVSIAESEIFDFYDVNIQLNKLADGNYKILNSNSKQSYDVFFLDCKQNSNYSPLCNLRRESDNKVVVLGKEPYSGMSVVFLGKENESFQYFYSAFADAGYGAVKIFGINKETGNIHLIGDYNVSLNPPNEEYYSNPICSGDGSDTSKLENYYTSECLLMFKDEPWYKDNIEYFGAEEKYLWEI
jgi:hypothetical protein